MCVYVDGLKAAGPVASVDKLWSLLKEIEMEPPTKAGRYIGRDHEIVQTSEGMEMHYNMKQYMKQCCERYLELAPPRPS